MCVSVCVCMCVCLCEFTGREIGDGGGGGGERETGSQRYQCNQSNKDLTLLRESCASS